MKMFDLDALNELEIGLRNGTYSWDRVAQLKNELQAPLRMPQKPVRTCPVVPAE